MKYLQQAFFHGAEEILVILPFLFFIYLILELLEHRFSHKTPDLRRFGPLLGSALGMLPQCGFSIAVTTLFNKRVVTLGTLLAVYLSTSDEAVPILLAQPGQLATVAKILVLKFFIGLLAGLVIDRFCSKPLPDDCFCSDCHQHSEDHQKHHHTTAMPAVLFHSCKKTLKIFLFLLAAMVILNWLLLLVGQEQLARLLSTGTLLQPFLCALVGLVPTCVPSILIAQLLAEGILPFGSAMAGLCASSGMGILLLFKEGHGWKTGLQVTALLYGVSVFCGLVLNLFF